MASAFSYGLGSFKSSYIQMSAFLAMFDLRLLTCVFKKSSTSESFWR